LKCDNNFALKSEGVRDLFIQAWCLEHLEFISKLSCVSKYYVGVDFGRISDLSVFMFFEDTQDLKAKCVFSVELRNVPFEQQKQILFYCCDNLTHFRGGAFDAGGNGQYLAEVAKQRYGAYRVEEVHIANKWYNENMPKYKARFENDKIILPYDRDVLEDNLLIAIIKGTPKVPDIRTKDATGNRHGDSAIAGCMGIYAVNSKGVPVIFTKEYNKEDYKVERRRLI
jgi:phage FluMu gp28-like protein